jgi:hypothetical protein
VHDQQIRVKHARQMHTTCHDILQLLHAVVPSEQIHDSNRLITGHTCATEETSGVAKGGFGVKSPPIGLGKQFF